MQLSPQVRNLLRPIYLQWESLPINRKRSRRKITAPYLNAGAKLANQWIRLETETDNFYYDLTDANKKDLASCLAALIGVTPQAIDAYIDELLSDKSLSAHISNLWVNNPHMRDAKVAYGRRIGWYAAVRAFKPKFVVETGVHHGVGACVLTSALIRNKAEGFQGEYLGTDIDPGAGSLFTEPYASEGKIVYGDSIQTLSSLKTPVDLFINDSSHDAQYEADEYSTILNHLAPRSIIIGDNSHVTSKLNDFSRETGRPFVFFKEAPSDHWYPGAGLGMSVSSIPLLK